MNTDSNTRAAARRAAGLRLRLAAMASATFASVMSMVFLLVVLMPTVELGAATLPA